MTKNINLLPQKKNTTDSHEGILLICKRIAVVALIFTAGTSIIFFLLTINPTFSSVKQQENSVLAKLSFTQGKIAKYLVIKNRLKGIEQILEKRFPMNTVLSAVQQNIPDDVSVDSVNITNKTAALKLSSSSLLSLNTVLLNTSALLANKKLFKKITVQSIVSNQLKQTYTLTIQAELL
ncbi:MAG TPA: hypothetical protein VLF89_03020 [Candidatus Saccharimonadales bacterium]|nr:hypothetical protein [Candidatus Saccharimonadales bacterium]